jgi:hypothetical protein
VPIGASGTSNLVGNPYPSALDANLFFENSVNLDGTIYLWTHNTAITNNLYTSDDYATYNLLGGWYECSVEFRCEYFKTGREYSLWPIFFVTSINNTGDLKFNNSMRLIGQNSSFLDLMGTRKQNKMRLRSIEFG